MREPYFSGVKYSWFWLELKMATFCGALCGGSQTQHHLDSRPGMPLSEVGP